MHYGAYKTKRQQHESLRAQLDLERQTFVSHWRDIGDHILPTRPLFSLTDTNKGNTRTTKILDSTGTFAAGILEAGMVSGVTSPARPWFRLTTEDPDLAEFGPVKDWLHLVQQRLLGAFARSNLYETLSTLYGDLGVFGTAPIYLEEDMDSLLFTRSFPIGSYWIATDHKGRVNTFMREMRMTVAQVIEAFGVFDRNGRPSWDNFSQQVKDAYDNGNYQHWVDVCHVIQPNRNHEPGDATSKRKRYESCYYERGSESRGGSQPNGKDAEKYLRESGYDYFPVLCPRWKVRGTDAYAISCPGMVGLPDVKQLQVGERRGLQGLDKMVNPPMKAPPEMKNTKTSILSGDITYAIEGPGREFKPAHEVNIRLDLLEQKQAQVRERINRAFYADLFLMLAQAEDTRRTATEIVERKEEKLVALGPVMHKLDQELLNPLIDIGFMFMDRQSRDASGRPIEGAILPPPPEEIAGRPLRVEYISVMAQAQKMIGLSGMERLVAFAGQMVAATGDPSSARKIDCDQALDEYANGLGVSPRVVRSDEDVEKIAQATAQAQQQQAMAEQAVAATGAVKNLSGSDMEGDNALVRLAEVANAGNLMGTA